MGEAFRAVKDTKGFFYDAFYEPKHPYTKALLASKPREDPSDPKKRVLLKGEIPNALNVPEGCRFWPRCPEYKKGVCDAERPLEEKVKDGHFVTCHLWQDKGGGKET